MNPPLPAATAATTEQDDPTIWQVDDARWALRAPVRRGDKVRKKPGRPRRADRAIVAGRIWLARTGAHWSHLPRQFGPTSTVHERFSEGGATGALQRLGAAVADVRRGAWSGLDRAGRRRRHRHGAVRPKGGAGAAQATGRTPTDRGNPGGKRHRLTAAAGVPVAAVRTGANRHARKKLAALLEATVVEPAPTPPPRLAWVRGDDDPHCRAAAVARGWTPHLPPQTSAATPPPPPGPPDRHPPRRGVVEGAHAWFNRCRRRLTRWEKRAATDLGFVHLAAGLIVSRKVRHARLLLSG